MRQRAADFDQVAFNKDLPIPPTVGRLIVAAERSAELLYHLGKNPELARRLAALPPTIAAKELGKIEAQLPASQATSAAPTSEQQRRATSAPAPVRTVKAGANPPRRSVESMSFDEYVAGRRSGAIK